MTRVWLPLIFAAVLFAQDDPDPAPEPATQPELLAALANAAATFARVAPGLGARELLQQRGRRGFVEFLNDQASAAKGDAKVRIPPGFRTHTAVSGYAFGALGDSATIRELRSLLSIDGHAVSTDAKVRHALVMGLQARDEQVRRRLLENFENERLEGAVTDFGQVILLFGAARQNNYDFELTGTRPLTGEPMMVLHYRQVSGTDGITVFRGRTEQRSTTEGDIWLRERDLLPLRITINTSEPLSAKHDVRGEAIVDYQATTVGLAPLHVVYRQFLDADLMMENDLQYTDVERLTPGLLP